MTVGELIERLSQCDPGLLVVAYGMDEGPLKNLGEPEFIHIDDELDDCGHWWNWKDRVSVKDANAVLLDYCED